MYPLAFLIIPFSIMEYAISITVVFGSLGWIPNTLVIRRVSKCMTCKNIRTAFAFSNHGDIGDQIKFDDMLIFLFYFISTQHIAFRNNRFSSRLNSI